MPVPYSNEYPFRAIAGDIDNCTITILVEGVEYAISCVQLLRDSAVAIAVNRGLMDPPVEEE